MSKIFSRGGSRIGQRGEDRGKPVEHEPIMGTGGRAPKGLGGRAPSWIQGRAPGGAESF